MECDIVAFLLDDYVFLETDTDTLPTTARKNL